MDSSARLDRISTDLRASFDAAIAEYDARVAERPFDITAQLYRCRFIDDFASMYEYASFITEVYDAGEQCRATLTQRYPEHPEVLLLQLEQAYGEQQLKDGDKVLDNMYRQHWTNGQQARLYSLLAKTAETLGRKNAADYAMRALDLDEASDVRLIVAARMIEVGEPQRAIETLTAPLGGTSPVDGWSVIKKIGLLSQAGAHEQAVQLYSKLDATAAYNHLDAARALRGAGAVVLARKELALAIEQGGYSDEDEKERFRFELALGTPQEALAAYDAWRDLGWDSDPLGINRVALAMRDLTLPWQARDLLAVLALLGIIALLAAALTVPLSFVHYRGLVRRARSGDAYPSDGWQLRHAWVALFAFGVASVLALYAAGPIDVNTAQTSRWSIDATPAQLARMTLFEAFGAIVLLLPLARLATVRQRSWWGSRWTIGKTVVIGIAIGTAFRIPLIVAALARPEGAPLVAPDGPVWELVTQLREQFGIFAALWLLAIVAPVVEEFVFRGVLLKALSAHISFAWANCLQAALFAAAHFDLKATPMLFAIGAVLGLMTRRSGGLAGPMIMHATFNLIAGLLFL